MSASPTTRAVCSPEFVGGLDVEVLEGVREIEIEGTGGEALRARPSGHLYRGLPWWTINREETDE